MKVKERKKLKLPLPDKALKQVFIYAGYLIAGFLVSVSTNENNLLPYGVALVSVSKKRGYIFSTLGASLGYFVFGINEYSTRYFAGVVIVGIVAFFAELLNVSHIIWIGVGSSFLSTILTGTLVNLRLDAYPSEYLLTLAQGIMASIFAFCYFKTINANYRQLRLKAMPISDIICIIFAMSSLLNIAKLGTIWYFYPLNILAISIMLFAVRYSGEKWGTILGITLGFCLTSGIKEGIIIGGVMGISAIVASLLSPFSFVGIACGEFSTLSLFAIIIGGQTGLSLFFDSLIGTLIFVLMPSKLCSKIEELFFSTKDITPEESLRQSLVLKLRLASSAMTAISDSVDQVRERINQVARKNDFILKQQLSPEEYATKQIIIEQTNQIRMVASDQFFSISDMLKDLAIEFSDAEKFDSQSSNKINTLLHDNEIYPQNISTIIDKFGRMRVEILLDSSIETSTNIYLQKEIGKICNRYFDIGKIASYKENTLLSFMEKPNYYLNIGFAQHSAEGELCGDTVKIINDSFGHSILIISDGMGTGSRAALDGAMGAGLIAKLINSGFGFDSALKVVNSALLLKSNDESLATLDIASIDLFTGICEIFKAGAPCSYIIKDTALTKCELSSMPIGILRGIEFAKRTAVLSPNDKIILMSDGITDLGEDWLKSILNDLPYSPQDSADYILAQALDYSKGKNIDDMSIIFATLERN